MILLTLVRKSELIEATWDEVNFENGTWTIPKQRMKGRNPHVVYLSRQALDILVALHTCAAGSKFVLPSRYDSDRCMSHATLNRVTQIVAQRAKAAGLPLEPFTVHDLRRTGSKLLNEIGFNRDWIEKCLAHEEGRSSRSIYNKAEYAEGQGWRVEVGGSHAWGRIYCPYNDAECRCGEFCITSVWSTPKSPGNHARALRRVVDNCTTQRKQQEAANDAQE